MTALTFSECRWSPARSLVASTHACPSALQKGLRRVVWMSDGRLHCVSEHPPTSLLAALTELLDTQAGRVSELRPVSHECYPSTDPRGHQK
jgi:hypothetical protein